MRERQPDRFWQLVNSARASGGTGDAQRHTNTYRVLRSVESAISFVCVALPPTDALHASVHALAERRGLQRHGEKKLFLVHSSSAQEQASLT